MIKGLLIFMAVYLAAAILWRIYEWKFAPPSETEIALRKYAEYCELRDRMFPEMIGKWGKP